MSIVIFREIIRRIVREDIIIKIVVGKNGIMKIFYFKRERREKSEE